MRFENSHVVETLLSHVMDLPIKAASKVVIDFTKMQTVNIPWKVV